MSKYVLKQRGSEDKESLARQAFMPGMFLYGYCGGMFGRDSYGPNEIVSIVGNCITVKYGNHYMNAVIDGDLYKWSELLADSNSDVDNEDY